MEHGSADNADDMAERILEALNLENSTGMDHPVGRDIAVNKAATELPGAAASVAEDEAPLTSLLDFSVPGATPQRQQEAVVQNTGNNMQASTGTRDSNDISLGSRAGILAQLQESTASLEGECNLIVAGLTREVDDDGLKALFSPFGTVMSSTVMRHVGTGVSRGFGFVLFSKVSEGEAAVAAMHGRRCGPNTLNVHRSHHDGTVVETNAVFVRNLPLDVTPERVVSFFSPVATPTSIDISADTGRDAGDAPTGKRYKVATVAFSDIDSARRVVRNLHNRQFPAADGEESPLVIVKFADRRRRARARRTPTSNTGSPNHASRTSPGPTVNHGSVYGNSTASLLGSFPGQVLGQGRGPNQMASISYSPHASCATQPSTSPLPFSRPNGLGGTLPEATNVCYVVGAGGELTPVPLAMLQQHPAQPSYLGHGQQPNQSQHLPHQQPQQQVFQQVQQQSSQLQHQGQPQLQLHHQQFHHAPQPLQQRHHHAQTYQMPGYSQAQGQQHHQFAPSYDSSYGTPPQAHNAFSSSGNAGGSVPPLHGGIFNFVGVPQAHGMQQQQQQHQHPYASAEAPLQRGP